MNLKLRPIEEPGEAEALVPLLRRAAEADPILEPAEGEAARVVERFLGDLFARPESLLLVAQADGEGEPRALCVTAPFEDPLSGECLPMVVLLHVESSIRHRGVARALVHEAARLLRARGHGALLARALHNDDAVISMGERWGFLREWELMRGDEIDR